MLYHCTMMSQLDALEDLISRWINYNNNKALLSGEYNPLVQLTLTQTLYPNPLLNPNPNPKP